jgi:hypothetical protein
MKWALNKRPTDSGYFARGGWSVLSRTHCRAMFLVCIAILTGCSHHATGRYRALDVMAHQDPNLIFRFSASDATSDSPVVITAPRREITAKDVPLLTSLRGYWIAQQLSGNWNPVALGSAECKFHLEGKRPLCETVELEELTSKQHQVIYFYAGNWRYLE